jgi:hypothetical protein
MVFESMFILGVMFELLLLLLLFTSSIRRWFI